MTTVPSFQPEEVISALSSMGLDPSIAEVERVIAGLDMTQVDQTLDRQQQVLQAVTRAREAMKNQNPQQESQFSRNELEKLGFTFTDFTQGGWGYSFSNDAYSNGAGFSDGSSDRPFKFRTEDSVVHAANEVWQRIRLTMPLAPALESKARKSDNLMSITNELGVEFNVRLIRAGDMFGKHLQLIHEGAPVVEFYDARYGQDRGFTVYGQLVSSYALDTFLAPKSGGGSFCLQGGVPNWEISDQNVKDVQSWLREVEHARENRKVVAKAFSVAGVNFAAVRTMHPRPHWLLRLEETGEVLQSGSGGISNESVPKMIADIEELLSRVSKGDVADFRSRFGLNITIKTATGEAWNLEPVALTRLPSHDAQDWLAFKKESIPGTSLGLREQDRLQTFIRKREVECFSCRGQYVTLSGGMLANCDPTPFLRTATVQRERTPDSPSPGM